MLLNPRAGFATLEPLARSPFEKAPSEIIRRIRGFAVRGGGLDVLVE